MMSFDDALLQESLIEELDDISFSKECVYFIKDVNTNFVKVGRTSDIYRRFRELQEPSVVKLEIFHLVYTENSKELEKHFHRIFNKYHQWGEVFYISDTILQSIREGWDQ